MSNKTYNADWFLPGGKRNPGSLVINKAEGTMKLEIYSRESIEGTKIEFPMGTPNHYHRYIMGDSNGESFTLYHCQLSSCSQVGNEFYRSEYEGEYLINGAHISNTTGFMVKSGKFLFPNLSSWYDGSESFGKLDHIKGNLQEIYKEELESLTIDDNLTLKFIDLVRSRTEQFGASYTIDHSKYLVFEYANSVPFSQLLTDSISFLKLLEFSFTKPLNHRIIAVTIDTEHTTHNNNSIIEFEDINYSVTNFSLGKNKEISTHRAHQNHMIVNGWKLSKKELNKVIIKWFSLKSQRNIIEHYIDSNNWFEDSKTAKLSNVMFNNRFLNLIQGLEDHYRENFEKTSPDQTAFNVRKQAILKSIIDPELKQWFNNTLKFTRHPRLEEKLKAIVDDCMPIVKEIYGEISFDAFPNSAKDFRNQLSHGMNKKINLGDKLHLDFLIAQFLLMLCIMKTLEINYLNRLLRYHHELGTNIQRIRYFQKNIEA